LWRQRRRWLAWRRWRGGALGSNTKLENVLGFPWGSASPCLFYLYTRQRYIYNTTYVTYERRTHLIAMKF
jgi:hypothetical protein